MRADGGFSVAEACRSVGHSIFVTPKGYFLCEGRRTPDESRILDVLRTLCEPPLKTIVGPSAEKQNEYQDQQKRKGHEASNLI